MSDLRQDPISGQWVVISELRSARPNEFRQVDTRRSDLSCPFCKGFEHSTPTALETICADEGEESWLIRVVPNKYPALVPAEQESEKQAGPYRLVQSSGSQEIIIHSPRHVASLSQLTNPEIEAGMQACQNRLRNYHQQSAIQHVMLFTNCRSEAGASLEHIHSQLVGTPIISPSLQTRLDRACDFFDKHGTTSMHQIVEWEMNESTRLISNGDDWAVFCPFASRFPYQVWIAPRQPIPDFASCDERAASQLGFLIRDVVDRLEQIHDFPAYNVMFHTADNGRTFENQYQWYVEIVPRLTRFAGYELGTGCWINHINPDTAAQQIRQVPSSFEAN